MYSLSVESCESCIKLVLTSSNTCKESVAVLVTYVVMKRNGIINHDFVLCYFVQLPKELLLASMGPLVNLLLANSQVVHSYAACCIEKILNYQIPGAGFA